jgi:hypothetical protein
MRIRLREYLLWTQSVSVCSNWFSQCFTVHALVLYSSITVTFAVQPQSGKAKLQRILLTSGGGYMIPITGLLKVASSFCGSWSGGFTASIDGMIVDWRKTWYTTESQVDVQNGGLHWWMKSLNFHVSYKLVSAQKITLKNITNKLMFYGQLWHIRDFSLQCFVLLMVTSFMMCALTVTFLTFTTKRHVANCLGSIAPWNSITGSEILSSREGSRDLISLFGCLLR